MERFTEIQQINSSIMFGDFTNDQLNSIIAAVKYRRNQLTNTSVRSLIPGVKVKFTNSRNGQTVIGSVSKVNRKFVIVDTGITRWRVPGNMLETV
jgi:hypothetical protein